MDLALKDKVFIITGGTAGLGLATAKVLAEKGANVLVSGRSAKKFEAIPADIAGYAQQFAFEAGDTADADLPSRLRQTAINRWGRLDGLLVSTGGPSPSDALTTHDAAWRNAVESVFLGAVRLVRELGPTITPGGAVVLVLAISAKEASMAIPISNGLRPGLALLTKSFADELGERNIRVNALLPNAFATNRVTQLLGDRDFSTAGIALKRIGRPEEFGRMAALLLSPMTSYVTGAAIPIDGGQSKAL